MRKKAVVAALTAAVALALTGTPVYALTNYEIDEVYAIAENATDYEFRKLEEAINDIVSESNSATEDLKYDIKTMNTKLREMGYRIDGIAKKRLKIAEKNLDIHNCAIIALSALIVVQFLLLFRMYRKLKRFPSGDAYKQ
ncbi:MAG: hypothetical protein LBS24_07405 [Clostridiales Family XIII bacterium]|jgi:hypothetical protein|nr:hypothetical protein [Clostridiales Family XIII bacterium]